MKNSWKNYRNRWVYFKGKKIKLRKYIYVSARYMTWQKKKGWHGINHVQNYKNALALYGFKGLKIYEDYFYKGIPLPEKRSIWVKIGLFLAPLYFWFFQLKNTVLTKLKLK